MLINLSQFYFAYGFDEVAVGSYVDTSGTKLRSVLARSLLGAVFGDVKVELADQLLGQALRGE